MNGPCLPSSTGVATLTTVEPLQELGEQEKGGSPTSRVESILSKPESSEEKVISPSRVKEIEQDLLLILKEIEVLHIRFQNYANNIEQMTVDEKKTAGKRVKYLALKVGKKQIDLDIARIREKSQLTADDRRKITRLHIKRFFVRIDPFPLTPKSSSDQVSQQESPNDDVQI